MTARASWWAVRQMRREHASVLGLARQLGTTWKTVWRAVKPLLEVMDADPTRFNGVETLGVDQHIWHHVSIKDRGPKELTGMLDLTRDAKGNTRARLLDSAPGRSGAVYTEWLMERGHAFKAGVKIATLDPFPGYKNAIDDQFEDPVAVVDAFHIVKLGGQALDEVRRGVQQETLGHRGRQGDPLYALRLALRCGIERLTERQGARITAAIDANEAHVESSSPGSRPSSCAPRSTTRTSLRAAESQSTSWPPSPPARSPRSPASDEHCVRRVHRFWPTSPPAAPNNGGTEAVIIWTPPGAVSDVADGPDPVRQRHVVWSAYLTGQLTDSVVPQRLSPVGQPRRAASKTCIRRKGAGQSPHFPAGSR